MPPQLVVIKGKKSYTNAQIVVAPYSEITSNGISFTPSAW